MPTVVNIREPKRMENKLESEQYIEDSKSSADPYGNICEEEKTKCDKEVTNTVHIQRPLHYPNNVVQTSVLPRTTSEQSRLRILTRTPAVHCLSSPPSEESEDLPPDNETQGLKHQSSKDGSGSGPPSLCSSRDSSFDYTDSTGTDLYEFIVNTLKNPRDKKMLLKLEKDFLAFISDHRKVFLQYPPMTSYHRMIVHRVAAYFGLDHNVDPTGKCIIVNKCPSTRFPEVRFSELVREDSEEDPSPKLILRRQDSLSEDSMPPEKTTSHSRRTLEDKKSKSIEEREEEYVKARARIFNHGSLSSQSSQSSKEGDAILSGLRDASIDDESVLPSGQIIENVNDKTNATLPPAVKVLTKSSKSIENSKLAQDANTETCSSTTSETESTLSVDTSDTVSVEGPRLLMGSLGLPPIDIHGRSKILGSTGMVPILSPNQTGGVVWTLPENQPGPYPSAHGSLFPGPAESYPASNMGIQQGHGGMSAFFYPDQPNQSFQPQSSRQPTASQQQAQSNYPGQGIPAAYGSQNAFPVYQTPRVYSQQDLVGQEMVPQVGAVSQGGGHGMVVTGAGNTSSNYQELNNQLAGLSLSQLEQQELQKQRQAGSTYSPTVTQTFPAGQPVQYVVYRHSTGTMVAQPIQTQPGYLYSSPAQGYNQPPFNPQIYNPQVYSQQPLNPHYTVTGDQNVLAHRAGAHTPPTPPPSGSPMGTTPGFMPHVPTMPCTSTQQQFPTPGINAPIAQVPARLMNPYPIQGQQVIALPSGQQICTYPQPYSVGQPRTSVQQPPRFKPYLEKGLQKSVEMYPPDNQQKRPSQSDSPRPSLSTNNQNRRMSGGVAGKTRDKNETQRGQSQQNRGKQRHKRSQQKYSADSSRKQLSASSSTETDSGTCVLEIYDVMSNPQDLDIVVGDLLQSGAQIAWNENTSQYAGQTIAKAIFNSPSQADHILRTNTNPNYKLRRCPADIPGTESRSY